MSLNSLSFIVVIRDVVSVALRNAISVDADVMASIEANLALQTRLFQFVRRCPAPHFIFSYEKMIVAPERPLFGLAEFVGCEDQASAVARMLTVVKPSDPDYVAAMTPSSSKSEGHIDIVSDDLIAGWVKVFESPCPQIDIFVNGTQVGSCLANGYRPDVAAHLKDDGRHGFSCRPATSLPAGRVVVEVRDHHSSDVLMMRVREA